MSKALNRREILKGATILGSAAVTGAAFAEPAKQTTDLPQGFSFAEKLAGVDYSPAERAMVFDELEGMVDRIRRRRAQVPLNEYDSPAMAFNPRLPGRTYMPQENKVTLAVDLSGQLPDDDEDIAFASTCRQARWIKSGLMTSSRLTEIYLNRIEKFGPKLECFITVTAELAREQAYQADITLRNGRHLGPLHGIPYGLKDLFDTKGISTTWGAEPYKDRVPGSDATVYSRLKAAGAVMLGKTTLGALAYGDKWFGGLTRNPWNPDEGSSGSSAGSASAAAAGLCSFAIGTETLGSIVSPVSRCGATGLRPTFGRIPRTGAMPLCWSLDKVGPICRRVEDTALILAILNGADNQDPTCHDWGFQYDGPALTAANLKVGYDAAWFGEGAANSDRIALNTMRDLGFTLVPISLPDLPYTAMLTNLEVEAAASFEELTLSGRDDLLSWQDARAWPNTFRAAHFHSAVESLQLDRFRRKVMTIMDTVYQEVDLIICPNFLGNMLVITNFTGHPCLTLPVALEKRATAPLIGAASDRPGFPKNVPHAITLWGNMFREDQLIAAGQLMERSFAFTERRPQL